MPPLTLMQRAANVRLLVLDIDGVLTDGRVLTDSHGGEIKSFDIKDGHGLKLLMRTGIQVALLSGRASLANQARAGELGITDLREGVKIKLPVFRELLAAHGLQPSQAAFMGDDLIDLPPLRAAGLALAPADAMPEVRAAAHWIARQPGGRGAVRAACQLILHAQGTWDEVIARYFEE